VGHTGKHLQGVCDSPPTLLLAQFTHEAHSAGIFVIGRVIKSTSLWDSRVSIADKAVAKPWSPDLPLQRLGCLKADLSGMKKPIMGTISKHAGNPYGLLCL
jgi:hypothetical protein